MICIEDENRNQIEELERLMKEKLGIKFPFYMLHVYGYTAGIYTDDRAWFIETYDYNGEEFYGSDAVKEYMIDQYGFNYVLGIISRFKKFKQYARAKKFADEKNDWNGLYELKIEKIEKVEDMLI